MPPLPLSAAYYYLTKTACSTDVPDKPVIGCPAEQPRAAAQTPSHAAVAVGRRSNVPNSSRPFPCLVVAAAHEIPPNSTRL